MGIFVGITEYTVTKLDKKGWLFPNSNISSSINPLFTRIKRIIPNFQDVPPFPEKHSFLSFWPYDLIKTTTRWLYAYSLSNQKTNLAKLGKAEF